MVMAQRVGTGATVIRPGTVVGDGDLRPLRQLLEALGDEPKAHVVLDFSGTRHIHYRTADLISHHSRLLHDRHGHLILVGLSGYVRSILAFMTHVDRLEIEESTECALALYGLA